MNTFGGYTCSCVAGYTGTDCGKGKVFLHLSLKDIQSVTLYVKCVVLFNSTTATHISPSLEVRVLTIL